MKKIEKAYDASLKKLMTGQPFQARVRGQRQQLKFLELAQAPQSNLAETYLSMGNLEEDGDGYTGYT